MNDLSEIKKQCQMIIQKAIRSLAAAQRNMDGGNNTKRYQQIFGRQKVHITGKY